MTSFLYEAVDAGGLRSKGSLEVLDQNEALKRIKDMGLFPTWVRPNTGASIRSKSLPAAKRTQFSLQMNIGRIKPAALTVFTRQLATLVDVGMPLLRGLRLLQEQETNREMKRIVSEIARTVESGGTMSEGLAQHPKVFSRLYVNMVKAGEMGGILEQVLKRQAEYMEKALKIKRKIQSGMFYPASVMVVAAAIITLLMVYIIPKFKEVFNGLGMKLPEFTLLVLNSSSLFKDHILAIALTVAGLAAGFRLVIHTRAGRRWFDGCKLKLPVTGGLTRKISLSRFTRTLGTLLGSGVPILQALTIVKETTGNAVVSEMVAKIHDNVEQGGTLADPFKAAKIFPAMAGGMVDVGEQTGALPDMLLKIAETSDDEVDTAVSAMTSLLEPVMIVFLAVVVGSIVIAMFLPIFKLIGGDGFGSNEGQ